MGDFERYAPERRGRAPQGMFVRLTSPGNKTTAPLLRITREALESAGIHLKHGDHVYFLIDVDRETGAIRFTRTDDVVQGRMINPTNRQIAVGKRFLDWTGWGESRWALREENGVLIGDVREVVKGYAST